MAGLNLLEKPVYQVGEIEIDPSRRTVKRNGQEYHLQLQTFQVLLYLIEHRQRFVTKDELIENVWQVSAVTDNALVQCIVEIRKALGDAPRSPRFVKTLPKLGYHFIAEVTERPPEMNQAKSSEPNAGITAVPEVSVSNAAIAQQLAPSSIVLASNTRRVFLVATAIALLVIVVGAVWRFNRSTNAPNDVVLPAAEGKKTLAVMYFHNQTGAEELDWMREGLADMFITTLSKAKLIVLSRQQLQVILDRIGHRKSSEIGLEVARDVAQRSRAEVVLMGSFTKVGDKIHIDAQLLNGRNGQLLTAERIVVDNENQILAQVDLLSLRLASHLGAPLGQEESKVDLAGAMTNNLEAYRYYSLGLEKLQAFQNSEAVALLEKAIKLDPEFAMAYARIGYTYAAIWGLADKGKPFLEKAFKLSDRLSEKEKLNITAWYAVANRDYPRAIEMFRKIIAQYPTEVEAYLRLGGLLQGENKLDEALETLKQGLIIDGESKELINIAGNVYSQLGRHEEAILAHQRYVALAPTEPNAYDSLGLSYQWAGRGDEAETSYHRALTLDPEFEVAVIHLGNVYFQQGRYREAIEQYKRFVQLAPLPEETGRGNSYLTHVYLRKGDRDQAKRFAALNFYEERLGAWNRLQFVSDRDQKAAAELEKTIVEEPPWSERGGRVSTRISGTLRGFIHMRHKRFDEAIESFKLALRDRPSIWFIEPLEDVLANAYLEIGRLDEAIAEYERVLRLNPNYPLAHYHLGQAYARKGDTARARQEYSKFLEIWNKADADVPEIIEAKKAVAGS